jgi:hypothetical protein
LIDQRNLAFNNRVMRRYLEPPDPETLAEPLPRRIVLADPKSFWSSATIGRAFSVRSTNKPIDAVDGVILDAIATPAHGRAEVEHKQANAYHPVQGRALRSDGRHGRSARMRITKAAKKKRGRFGPASPEVSS